MKCIFLFLSMLLLGAVNGQTAFEEGMIKGLAQYKEAATVDEMQAAATFFEEVGDTLKDKWLPYYYAAHATLLATKMTTKPNKDKAAEKINALIAKAEALEPDNSELFCLKQMVTTMQITVNPMSRWQSYGEIAAEAIANAKTTDPSNPRPYLLEGLHIMSLPESIGGGKELAKKSLQKAVWLFDSFEPLSPFHPNWGKEQAVKALAACQ